jgi:hypothetical protein
VAFAEPLTNGEIERPRELGGWTRRGEEISRTFGHAYCECVPGGVRGGEDARGTVSSGIYIRW